MKKEKFSDFDAEIKSIQRKLALVQQAYIQQKRKAVIVLEGVDAAGKGGLIRRLAWCMDPRTLKVWPIGAPEAVEKTQHYLQRFWTKLPVLRTPRESQDPFQRFS
jgi:polyphosphate kinase 2 (PPK2 family)